MLQWNDLHPYNAVHVARVPGQLDPALLRRTINAVLERKGLTGLRLAREHAAYQYDGGPAPTEILVCADGASPTDEIERQLNTPFPAGERLCPFRFFAMPEPDAFGLGLAYFHPVADAECVIHLLQDIVETYREGGDPRRLQALDCHPPRRDRLWQLPPAVLARTLARFPSFIRPLRRALRPHFRDPGRLENRLLLFSLAPARLQALRQAAKAWGVTLNDLFLALLLKAVSAVAPEPAPSARRREIALGCIVNTRRDLELPGRKVFGLFLGSFVVRHPAPARSTLAELARDVGRQTLRIKRTRLYLAAALELTLGRLAISRFPVAQRAKLYPKHYPLWGGITNVDLNHLWPQPGDTPAVDYVRAVCTGPVTPLVLSVTTVGPKVNIGLTYRPTVFSGPNIESIREAFLTALDTAAAHA